MRYVVGHPEDYFTSVEQAQEAVTCDGECIFELGPEVKEPDYTKLVEWVKKYELEHQGRLCGIEGPAVCPCGLADALKDAQIT